ncbi:MAG TPA: diacylglycerol kinase family protein [Deinococcales bacterium]|nr:diacylglycerol kinase family protein [Deinococcales bacterium]
MEAPVPHYLVYNSSAGRGRLPAALSAVRTFFAERNLPLEVLPPLRGRELQAALAGLPADARVLSMGGDGTLNGVLEPLVHSDRTLGVLPAGSADDFAAALGLPNDSLVPALEAIAAGRTRLVDTGRATLTFADGTALTTRFVNALGTGFDAEVAERRESTLDWLKGAAGYYAALAVEWFSLRREHLSVQVDGETVWADVALLATCQNGPRTGGSFWFTPAADPADGRLNVLVAGDVGRLGLVRLLPKVLKAEPLDHPLAGFAEGAELELRWRRPRTVHLDGELYGAVRHVAVTVDPGSLRVFVP